MPSEFSEFPSVAVAVSLSVFLSALSDSFTRHFLYRARAVKDTCD